MYGSDTCEDSIRSREFLDRLEIAYRYVDVDKDSAAGTKSGEFNDGHLKTPTITFGDQVLIEPTDEELGSALRHAGIYPPEAEVDIV